MSDPKCHNTDENGRRAIVLMNKKKYSVLEKHLREFSHMHGINHDTLAALCETICKALEFNPEMKAYKAEEVQRRKAELKKKLTDNNMTTYEAYGKAYYETHKQECMQRVAKYKSDKKTSNMIQVS